MSRKLAEALPDFVADLEGALVSLGRGDLVKQLREAPLERWTLRRLFRLHLSAAERGAGGHDERRAPFAYDELGVNVDSDQHGRLCGIEILEGKRVARQLETDTR